MKFFVAFFELLTSPFTYLLKKASGKNILFPIAKVFMIALISIILVGGLVLLVYKDYIFR